MMRAFHRFAAMAIVFTMMPGLVAAAVRYAPIHPERQKMSPADRRDAVLADLESILTSSATPTSIATKPRLSSKEALCRRDVIELSYPRTRNNRAWAARPDGIFRVSPEYHYLGYVSDRSRDDWEKACARLTSDKIAWIRAGADVDDNYVSDAFGRLEMAVADVRKGANVTITCEDIDGSSIDKSTMNCAGQAFLDAASNVSEVGRCIVRGGECYEFSTGGQYAEISFVFSNGKHSTSIKLRERDIVEM